MTRILEFGFTVGFCQENRVSVLWLSGRKLESLRYKAERAMNCTTTNEE